MGWWRKANISVCRSARDRKKSAIAPQISLRMSAIVNFNVRIRDELLDGEIFNTLSEARVVMESVRRFDNRLWLPERRGHHPSRLRHRLRAER
jgi:putative transposase